MTIKLADAAEFYKGLQHQVDAWNWLQSQLTDEQLSTFATKYPTLFNPADYNLKPDKHRIRVSLMPQKYSDVLER